MQPRRIHFSILCPEPVANNSDNSNIFSTSVLPTPAIDFVLARAAELFSSRPFRLYLWASGFSSTSGRC